LATEGSTTIIKQALGTCGIPSSFCWWLLILQS
jgi:hypothetical protein